MARSHPALYPHILSSQYRGVLAYNMADTPPVTPPADTPLKGDDDKSGFQTRISALVGEREAEKAARLKAEAEAAQLRAEKKAEEDAKLAEQGKFKDLLEKEKEETARIKAENEAATKKLTTYEAAAKARVEKRLEGIKDENKRKEVASLIDGLDVLSQDAKLDTLMSLIQTPSSFGGSPPAGGSDTKAKEQEFADLTKKVSDGKASAMETQRMRELAAEIAKSQKVIK